MKLKNNYAWLKYSLSSKIFFFVLNASNIENFLIFTYHKYSLKGYTLYFGKKHIDFLQCNKKDSQILKIYYSHRSIFYILISFFFIKYLIINFQNMNKIVYYLHYCSAKPIVLFRKKNVKCFYANFHNYKRKTKP